MTKAPLTEKLVISGPAGKLEVLLEAPAGAVAQCIAILCHPHPHPQHQGTMRNKVVHTMARYERSGLALQLSWPGRQ